MHLVQLLLPLADPSGNRFPGTAFDDVVRRLTERFGGVTAYTRSPATGLWEADSGERVRDLVVVYEVMVDELEPAWWAEFRQELEARFEQEEIVVRAQEIERL